MNKSLNKAGADTAPMREAALFRGLTEREIQRARFRVMRWLTHGRPRGAAIRKIEGPAPKAIEPPHVEDTAA